MNRRNLCIVAALAAALTAAWFGWREFTAPRPPRIALEGVDPATADAVREALADVRRQPRSGEAWGQLAMLMAANGFYEQLPDCYTQAERLDPENPAWPYLHGVHLLEVNPDRALPLLEKSLTLTENPAELTAAHFRLAQTLIELGRLDQADRHLQSLRQLDPAGPRTRFLQALLALARGERDVARQQLSTLADDSFTQKRACTLLAGLVDKDQAAAFQQRAARLPADRAWPDPIEARMIRRKVDRTSRFDEYRELSELGRHAEALNGLRRLAQDEPDHETCFMLGYALYTRQAFEEAEANLRQALRFDPNNVRTRLLIGSCLLQRGEKLVQEGANPKAAEDLFRRALDELDATLALQKEHGFAHMYRGWTLKHLGRSQDALEALRHALLIHPNLSEVHLYLGQTLAEAGQLTEGLAHLETAVRFAGPTDPRPTKVLETWRAKVKASPNVM